MQAMLDEVAPKLKIGVRMLSKTVRADAREGDIGMQLGEIAKANPGVAIGSYPFFDPHAWAQHERGAARPRCTEARAGQTCGRGDAGASACRAEPCFGQTIRLCSYVARTYLKIADCCRSDINVE